MNWLANLFANRTFKQANMLYVISNNNFRLLSKLTRWISQLFASQKPLLEKPQNFFYLFLNDEIVNLSIYLSIYLSNLVNIYLSI